MIKLFSYFEFCSIDTRINRCHDKDIVCFLFNISRRFMNNLMMLSLISNQAPYTLISILISIAVNYTKLLRNWISILEIYTINNFDMIQFWWVFHCKTFILFLSLWQNKFNVQYKHILNPWSSLLRHPVIDCFESNYLCFQ